MNNKIPNFIHQIWLNGIDKIPKKFNENRLSWIENNSSYYYKIWDLKSLKKLLYNYYPNLTNFFKKIKYQKQKQNFFIYLLLYHFGGIYIDIHYKKMDNLDFYLKDKNLIFILKKNIPIHLYFKKNYKYLSTKFIASSKNNIFWMAILKEIIIQSYNNNKFETKKQMIERTFGNELLSNVNYKYKKNDIKILNYHIIQNEILEKLNNKFKFSKKKYLISKKNNYSRNNFLLILIVITQIIFIIIFINPIFKKK